MGGWLEEEVGGGGGREISVLDKIKRFVCSFSFQAEVSGYVIKYRRSCLGPSPDADQFLTTYFFQFQDKIQFPIIGLTFLMRSHGLAFATF